MTQETPITTMTGKKQQGNLQAWQATAPQAIWPSSWPQVFCGFFVPPPSEVQGGAP